jgi:hypothetical protein
MDDSQDKVRRNVVVAAALIILIQYLQIQIVPGANISIFKITKVSEFRLWSLALIVLVYLFQRYWFDKNTKDQKDDARKEFFGFRGALIQKNLQNDAQRYVCNGRRLKFFADLSEVLSKFQAPNYSPDTFDHIRVVVHPYGTGPWMLKGANARVLISRIKNGNEISSVGSEWDRQYRLPLWNAVQVSINPILRICLFSKSAVDFVVPIYLSIGALGVCLFRLWRAIEVI